MNMKPIILFVVTFLLFNSVKAQGKKGSLQAVLNKAYSFHYTNRDSAYFYYKKVLKLANKANDMDNVLTAYTSLIDVASRDYDLRNYKDFLFQYEQFLNNDKRLGRYTSKSFFDNYLILDKGIYYYKIKNYPSAKKQFEKLHIKLKKKVDNKLLTNDIYFLTSTYSYLAIINRKTSKLDRASSIYEENIDFIIQHKDSLNDWQSRLANTKKLLALVKTAEGSYGEANQLLQETQHFYLAKSKNPQFKNNLLSSFIALAKNALSQQKYQEAIAFLNTSEKYYSLAENSFLMEFNFIYGDAYLGLKNFKTSLSYYEKNIALLTNKYGGEKHQDLARTYAKIAQLYKAQNQLKKSLHYLQKALIQLDDSFESMSPSDNPKPDTVSSKLVLLTILKDKLAVLLALYQQYNEIIYLYDAQKVAYATMETLDFLRPEFESKLDKKFLLEQTYPSIQKMVDVSYILYEKTKDEKYIASAFYFIEKSKSILLLEASRNAEATKYGDIPKSILNREQQYRAKIAYFEHEVFKKGKQNKQKDSLIRYKNSYFDFIKNIEQDYPKYYNLKYNQYVVSITDVQKKLEADALMVSYLVSADVLYAIAISQDKTAIFKLPFSSEIQTKIKKLYQKSAELDINDNEIYSISNQIYNTVLDKILKKMDKQKLIIINDDLLNYIPFDALVTNTKENRFLINNYSVSYNNSATLWYEKKNKTHHINENKLLGFAPQFQDDYFAPLRYNKEELEEVSKLFEAKTFLNDSATLIAFTENCTSFNLIHLATHAVANDANPDYSYLAFSNSTKDDNLLFISDLYNYQIDADLVVLSACETGVGKLQKGEGMLSLARAFNYAGVDALVTTLWKIDDESTSQIMIDFYANLKQGLTKSEALRQAKLTYLKKHDNDMLLQHPYYWSGIVLVGDTNQIAQQNNVLFYGLLILVLFMLFLLVKKLR